MVDFKIIHPDHYFGLENEIYVDRNNIPQLRYGFVKALNDTGIWNISAADLEKIKEQKEKEREEREYKQYLRLKEKFEPNNKN